MAVHSYLWEAQCVACGHTKGDHIFCSVEDGIEQWACKACQCSFSHRRGSLEIYNATTKHIHGATIALHDAPNTCDNCGHVWEKHTGPIVNQTRNCEVPGCTCVLGVIDYPQLLWDQQPSPVHDLVEHPVHYTQHPSGVECIQITEHMNFCLGNAVKYIWRAGLKQGAAELEDLRKARWYLDREITRRESLGPGAKDGSPGKPAAS